MDHHVRGKVQSVSQVHSSFIYRRTLRDRTHYIKELNLIVGVLYLLVGDIHYFAGYLSTEFFFNAIRMTRNKQRRGRRGKRGRIPQARRCIPGLPGILAGLTKATLMMVSIIYLRTTYSSVYLMYSIDGDGERL